MVQILQLPPPVPAGRFWQSLDTAPGAVAVTIPALKPKTLTWAQAKRLHAGLTEAIIAAGRTCTRR